VERLAGAGATAVAERAPVADRTTMLLDAVTGDLGPGVRRPGLVRALDGAALAVLTLVVLDTAIGFLPVLTAVPYVNTTRVLLLAGIGAVAVRDRLRGDRPWRGRLPAGSAPVVAGAGLLLYWQLASSIGFTTSDLSLVRLLAEHLATAAFVVLLVDSREKLQTVLAVLGLAVGAVSLHAIRQFVAGENTEHYLLWSGGSAAGGHAETLPDGAIVRVVGYFADPNVLATWLVLLLPVVAVALWRAAVPRWAAALFLALPGAALALTFSRAPFLGLLIAAAVLLGRRRPWLPVALAAVAVVALANPLSSGRMISAIAPRLDVWAEAARVVVAAPLFGVGAGGFRQVAPLYYNAHNLFLQLGAEGGVVAAAAMVVVLAGAVRLALRQARAPGQAGALGVALAVSLVAFAVVSVLDNPYNARAVSATFWLLVGLLLATARLGYRPADARAPLPARRPGRAPAGARAPRHRPGGPRSVRRAP